MRSNPQWSIKPKGRQGVVVFLLLINLATGVLLLRFWWMNELARHEVFGFATYAGAMQAHADFANGVRRQYELEVAGEGRSRSGFTGRREGPFEVWRWGYYPDLGQIHQYGNRSFVEMYNSKMKYMEQYPDQFKLDEMGAHNETK